MATSRLVKPKGVTYVFVRPWKMGGVDYLPGDEIPNLARYRWRRLARRRIVGIKGSDWSERRIAFYRTKFNLPADEETPKEEASSNEETGGKPAEEKPSVMTQLKNKFTGGTNQEGNEDGS